MERLPRFSIKTVTDLDALNASLLANDQRPFKLIRINQVANYLRVNQLTLRAHASKPAPRIVRQHGTLRLNRNSMVLQNYGERERTLGLASQLALYRAGDRCPNLLLLPDFYPSGMQNPRYYYADKSNYPFL